MDDAVSAAGLRVAADGPVLTVTLAAPQRRNSQTPALWRELARIGAELDPEVRVVVLRADGPSFSAGLDRAMLDPRGIEGEPSFASLAAGDDATLDATIASFQQAFTWWRTTSAVTVAAVGGHAVGAGFQLALACDLRVLADDAQLSMRETTLGLVPDLGGTHPLVALVGYPRALEICATGRWVHADEAARIGLAELVVPRADLDAAVEDLTAALLASPAGAVRDTKALLRAASTNDPVAQQQAERTAQARRLRALATGRDV
jgi:enoyl-CoA hydratase/carnithine racemase